MVRKRGSNILISRKGMDIELWFNLFELVVVALVGVILVDMVNEEVKDTGFQKNYLSRDNALLLNTIYSSPGDIQYTYQEKTGKFIFDLKQNKIEVYEPNEVTEGGVVNYPFSEDRTYDLAYAKIVPKSANSNLVYSKSKGNIKIEAQDVR